MNRLVIVGNGFDIAHGLKTRYEDFLYDYLILALKEFERNGIYEDSFLKFNFLNHLRFSDGLLSSKLNTLSDLLKSFDINFTRYEDV